jgi:hypothetical protein
MAGGSGELRWQKPNRVPKGPSEEAVRPGRIRPDEPLIVLSASEIGTFAFCEEAWLLQRAGAVRGAEGLRRLEEGTLAHRRIGRKTDRVRHTDRMQRIVLLAILVLMLVVALEWVGIAHLVYP